MEFLGNGRSCYGARVVRLMTSRGWEYEQSIVALVVNVADCRVLVSFWRI